MGIDLSTGSTVTDMVQTEPVVLDDPVSKEVQIGISIVVFGRAGRKDASPKPEAFIIVGVFKEKLVVVVSERIT